jgi:hypothetical protein
MLRPSVAHQRFVLLGQRSAAARSGCARNLRWSAPAAQRGLAGGPAAQGSNLTGSVWNAPEAINRMWSVFTMPCLVETVQPSTSGSRSRCTPSRDTSGTGALAAALTDFVDLVDKHDAVLFNGFNRLFFQLFRVHQFGRFFFHQQFEGFFDLSACVLSAFARPGSGTGLQLVGHLFHARRSHDLHAHRRGSHFDSISLSSNWPSRSFLRNA